MLSAIRIRPKPQVSSIHGERGHQLRIRSLWPLQPLTIQETIIAKVPSRDAAGERKGPPSPSAGDARSAS